MNTELFSQINDNIQKDLATSRQLLALLETETQATKERDYNALALCLEKKAPLLEQLKQNAKNRSDWLQSINRNTNEANWLAFIKSTGDTKSQSELLKQWQEVKKTIEHCQHINTINGKLINRGVHSHSRLLQIMRGNLLEADLYDAHGSKQSTNFSGKVMQV